MSDTEFSGSIAGYPTDWGTSTAAGSVMTPNHTEFPEKKASGSPLAILNGCRVAAASFQNSLGRHLCVYWQDTKGMIRESLYLRNGAWAFVRCTPVTDRAKLYSPLGATLWANGVERRLFYLDQSNLIREALCSDGFSWSEDGSGLSPLKVATHSQSGLASGHWRSGIDDLCLRVFYQDQHSQLQELKYDSNNPGWGHAYKELPHALPGTALAFAVRPDEAYMHLYYQKPDGQPAEIHYFPWGLLNPLNMWYHGGYRPHGNYPLYTALACIVRYGHLRVFAHRGDGVISDTIWAPYEWKPTEDLPLKIENVSHFVAMEWREANAHGWQQHIIGMNATDGFWDYTTGHKGVELQKLFV